MSNFIDYVKIHCRSGRGGPGSTYMRREKYVPKGGPAGGDGGRGGHIIIKGNKQLWTLLPLKYRKHIRAEHGHSGGSNQKHGKDGIDQYVEVPLGTIVRDAETGEQIAEISEQDQEIIIMEGGKGGKGNVHFKSSTRQTPRYAQPGIPEKEGWLILELKVLADVGLVGFPNAGKSTLLSVVSAAKPEIADYAFTTLTPNLGIVAYRDYKSFVMADIPGIIEGAHAGKGLGLRFLRHIERNSVLLFMVPADADEIQKEYKILVNELSLYNPELIDKPRLLAISKSDMLDEELKDEIKKDLPDIPWVFISSVAQTGLIELKDMIWKVLND
jgi:GTPase